MKEGKMQQAVLLQQNMSEMEASCPHEENPYETGIVAA